MEHIQCQQEACSSCQGIFRAKGAFVKARCAFDEGVGATAGTLPGL